MGALLGLDLMAVVAAFGALLSVIVGVFFAGRSKGKTRERERQAEQKTEAVQTRRKIEDETNALDDRERRSELDRWVRRPRR